MYGGYDPRTDGTIGPSEVLDSYLRKYEELNPHVRVENLGRELNPDKLISMFIAGGDEAPDIIEIDVKFLKNFYEIGMLAPVPPELQAEIEEVVFPNTAHFVMMGPEMICIPGESMTTGLWYSREALEEAGMVPEPPKTVAELETMAKRLTRVDHDGQVERPGFVQTDWWALNHTALAMLAAEGGQVFDDRNQIAIDAPPAYRVVERLSSWLSETTQFFGPAGHLDKFFRGEIGLGLGYPWWLSGIKSSYDRDYVENFGVGLFPGGTGYGSFHYGHGYGVNKESKHLDEVWKLLRWLALKKVGDITPIGHMMANLGSLPNVRDDILSEQYARERAIYEGFIENLGYAPNTPEWEFADLGGAAQRIAEGKSHPKQAVEEVVVQINSRLKEREEWLKKQRSQ